MRNLDSVVPVVFACVLPITACDVGEAGNEAFVVRDSAGIEIVESSTPRWPGDAAWRLSEAPLVTIGSTLEGEPATQVSSVRIVQLDDGRIVVADRQSAELRFFDAEGAHLKTVARKGSGPGEFGVIEKLLPLPGDTLLVGEVWPSRQAYFSREGEFLHQDELPRIAGSSRPSATMHVLTDGTHLVQQGGLYAIANRTGAFSDSTALYAISPGADSATLVGSWPFAQFTGDGRRMASVAFAPTLRTTTTGTALIVGFTAPFEMFAYSADGRLRRIVRRAWTPVSVDQASKDAYLARYTGPDAPPALYELARLTTFADVHPAYDELLTDAQGNVWARTLTAEAVATGVTARERLSHAARWSVFDASGRWLAELDTPAGFEPMDIGRDRVAGVWRDSDGVQYVRVYRLIKP